MKDDPDHGFRMCVNALINKKCLKPYASTVPLATVCEESKKAHGLSHARRYPLLEQTYDGCNTQFGGSAYLEALDQYIDYDEDGKLRKCLLDENGVQLRDAEGNLKILRHRFAIYCDDIAAGADTLEELIP
jgi:hypothetical protein